jgi:hypothetical protein
MSTTRNTEPAPMTDTTTVAPSGTSVGATPEAERPGPGAARRTRPTRTPSLGDVFAVHVRRPTVLILAALTAIAITLRVLSGPLTTTDLLIAGLQVAFFPVLEWILHTGLLHWRPRQIGKLTIDPHVARSHRAHHADPRILDLVFIPMPALIHGITITVLIGVFAFPNPSHGLTFMAVQGVLASIYEWTHHLVHTDYSPTTRLAKAVRRNHRLHHYKNEHYWFTVTTSGTADRLLGTYVDPSEIPPSPTARSLHAEA